VICQNVAGTFDVPHGEAKLLEVSGHAPDNLVGAHRRPEEVSMIHVDDELG
jgi:hypothetical protein